MSAETASEAPIEAPRRGFGTATATFVVVASMVGTGVLTTSGFTVLSTESNALMLALWVVGGVVALCGALCVAELSAMLPRAGGDYVFLYEAYGPLVAFLTGWVSFLIGFGGPIAVSGFGAATYLLGPVAIEGAWHVGGYSVPYMSLAQLLLASAAILVFALVHASGARRSAWAQGVTTVLKYGILTGLAVVGLAAGAGRWRNLADLPPVARWPWTGMLVSLVYISYAYTGWNAAGYMAGEVEEPQRRVPRAILLGTGLVLGLYLALNLFYALALPVSAVQATARENPNAVARVAQLAASQLFGERASDVLSVAVGVTLLASLSAFVLTGPRVAFAMARAGQFPAFAGRLSPRTGAPAIATWVQVAWSLLLLWLWGGSFESILLYSSVGLAMFSMLTVASVYVLRWRRPDLPRPFRTPGYPVVPAVYLSITALLTGAAFTQRPLESALALGSILLGVPVYYVLPRRAAEGSPRASEGEGPS
jgi:APA family basic amino acid/polyamine antiporter